MSLELKTRGFPARLMKANQRYPGIDQDKYGGMTDIGRIIRDAWVFKILDETETCAGWSPQRISQLYDLVSTAWEPYGHLVSNLPREIRDRHASIHARAMDRARDRGWDPELAEDD